MDTMLCYADSPRTVYIEILYGCNLYCNYCYVGQQKNHRQPLVPALTSTRQLLQILKEEQVEEVVLLGGEPMLHPHFAEICTTIASLAFPYRGIVTNGTLMTQSSAQLLQQTGFWVDISFRAGSAETFDTITAKTGSFSKAFNAALLLSRLDMAVGIEIDCLPQNYDTLYEMVKMLIGDGVRIKQVQLHRILPEGDARQHLDNFTLTLEQWHVVFEQAGRIRDELGVTVLFEDGFPLCLVQPEYRDIVTPCPCGFTSLTIGPQGDVRHCACHSEPLGNIRHASLQTIWHNSLTRYRSTIRHHDACLACDLLQICRGGCSSSGGTKRDESNDILKKYFRPVQFSEQEKQTTLRRQALKVIIGQDVQEFE
jgi:radical SAM protein with 4Fe4S-binding SPASM domain